jgi:hypothetical protein
LAASPDKGDAPAAAPSRAYKLDSASYRDKTYPDGILLVDETGSEIELRQLTGKRKKDEVVVAKFHLEPNADVMVDGPLLRVSELSISLESPAVAQEVAELLRRPGREREASRRLSEAESPVSAFLEAREEALGLLSRMKVDPRGALLSAESMWTNDDTEPLDAVYSAYSKRLSESLEKMTSSLSGTENSLGTGVADRLYALAYTLTAVQNALFAADSDLVQELAALQELGIATTAQDLRMEKPTERLMLRAHEVLLAAITAHSQRG